MDICTSVCGAARRRGDLGEAARRRGEAATYRHKTFSRTTFRRGGEARRRGQDQFHFTLWLLVLIKFSGEAARRRGGEVARRGGEARRRGGEAKIFLKKFLSDSCKIAMSFIPLHKRWMGDRKDFQISFFWLLNCMQWREHFKTRLK